MCRKTLNPFWNKKLSLYVFLKCGIRIFIIVQLGWLKATGIYSSSLLGLDILNSMRCIYVFIFLIEIYEVVGNKTMGEVRSNLETPLINLIRRFLLRYLKMT